MHADHLLAAFHRGARHRQPVEVVEVIARPEAIVRHAVQLMRGAQDEVLLLDKPPYFGAPDTPEEFDGLARGVRWRVVYSLDALEGRWLVRETLFKYHASCYLTHSPVEAATALRFAFAPHLRGTTEAKRSPYQAHEDCFHI